MVCKMHHSRRLIAVLLLLAAVPSLALAAISVRYCKGTVQHQALEFVVDGVIHGGHNPNSRAIVEYSAQLAQSQDVQSAQESGCDDVSLLDSAFMPPIGKLQLLPFAALTQHFPVSEPRLAASSSIFAPLREVRTDPRVADRSTIVLRI